MSEATGQESAAELLSGSLGAVRDAMMAVENALAVDVTEETLNAAVLTAGDLQYEVENLSKGIRRQARKCEANQ